MELLQSIPLKKPTIPYISNVTGHWMKDEDAADPEYWIRHMCETVNFSKGIQSLLREGLGVALEVGPGRFLSSLIQQNVEEPSADVPCIASMGHVVRGYSEHYSLIKSAGMLAGMHVPFNWERFYQNEERRRVPLVPYPFFKQRYWLPQDTLSRREEMNHNRCIHLPGRELRWGACGLSKIPDGYVSSGTLQSLLTPFKGNWLTKEMRYTAFSLQRTSLRRTGYITSTPQE